MITGVIVCFWGILTGYNNDDKQDDYQHQYCHPESITDTYNRNLRPIYPVPSPGIPILCPLGLLGGKFNHPFSWNGFVGVLTKFPR
jgi:hypothetical protein